MGITDYRLQDARHTFAVRALRADATEAFVAHQLGHKTTAMVHQIYGGRMPNEAERTAWQRVAAVQDEASRLAAG